MKNIKLFASLTFALALTGCANGIPPSESTSLKFITPEVQTEWQQDSDRYRYIERPRRNADGSCRKRGCDNGKLFFDPGEPEPSVMEIHRGW